MFTGIIEEMGIVEKIVKGKLMHLVIRAQNILKDSKIGDSINVNGACLTAVNIDKKSIAFDVMGETQERTNLNFLKIGDGVNLERALNVNSRFGGHIVSGHVDSIGIVRSKIKQKEEFWLELMADEKIVRYLIPKGSIAIDGVSLTIVNVQKDYFSVSLIPHTIKTTNLGFKEEKDKVNLEVDMLAKYVFRYFEEKKKDSSGLSYDYLKKTGLIDD